MYKVPYLSPLSEGEGTFLVYFDMRCTCTKSIFEKWKLYFIMFFEKIVNKYIYADFMQDKKHIRIFDLIPPTQKP